MRRKTLILVLTIAMITSIFAVPATVFADTEETAPAAAEETADGQSEEGGTEQVQQTPAATTVEEPEENTTTTEEITPEEEQIPEEDPEEAAFKAQEVTLKGTMATNNKTAVLTWNKVEGAEGYGIYRLDPETDHYVWVRTIRGGSTLMSTVTLNTGMVNSFAVFAYRSTEDGNIRTDYSESIVFDMTGWEDPAVAFKGQIVTVNGTANGTTAVLKWNKVAGATGYGVYRLDPATGTYVWLKTVRSGNTTSLTVSLTLDSVNAFRVFAYQPYNGTTIRTAYSEPAEIDMTGITEATLFQSKKIKLYGAQLSNTSAKLTWGKVAGADGYGLYRYDAGSGRYVWYRTLAGASNCSTTVSLVAGQNNYFKVFAYKKINGENVRTAFSDYRRFNPPKATATATRTIAVANSKKGCAYVYGASGPSVFDCSGFTMYVMKQSGINLPHNAAAQYNVLASKNIGTDYSKAKPGDLVFYSYGGPSSSHHVGIYVGSGKVIHASSSMGRVVVTPINYTGGHVAAICRP